jgi:hypothetical protein
MMKQRRITVTDVPHEPEHQHQPGFHHQGERVAAAHAVALTVADEGGTEEGPTQEAQHHAQGGHGHGEVPEGQFVRHGGHHAGHVGGVVAHRQEGARVHGSGHEGHGPGQLAVEGCGPQGALADQELLLDGQRGDGPVHHGLELLRVQAVPQQPPEVAGHDQLDDTGDAAHGWFSLGPVFKLDASRDGSSRVIQEGSARRAMRDIVQAR